MIENYSYNGCPVIEIADFERAKLSLPNRKTVNNKTKSDTFTVFLDGNEEKFVMFDWDEKANRWRLRNRLVVDVNVTPKYHCSECSERIYFGKKAMITDHIVNLEVTKKKCKVCNTVSDI
jgi:hypothetical protein